MSSHSNAPELGPIHLKINLDAADYFLRNPNLPEKDALRDFFRNLTHSPITSGFKLVSGDLWEIHAHNHILYVILSPGASTGELYGIHRDHISQVEEIRGIVSVSGNIIVDGTETGVRPSEPWP